jgi:hypothetical protein
VIIKTVGKNDEGWGRRKNWINEERQTDKQRERGKIKTIWSSGHVH